MNAHLQNDPERAGGLIPDAQGEFVEQESGGVFDPRAFRKDTRSSGGAGPSSNAAGPSSGAGEPSSGAGEQSSGADGPTSGVVGSVSGAEGAAGPAMDDERMVGPGEEIDKAR